MLLGNNMRNLRPLSARESRQIIELVDAQYGCKLSLDFYFIIHERDRNVYLLSRDVAAIDLEALRVNSLGSYFCEINEDNTLVRLSIEGSQIVGPHASQNIVLLEDDQFKLWAKGITLAITHTMQKQLENATGYVIIKNARNDYYGVGRAKNNELLNFTPKNRRIAADA